MAHCVDRTEFWPDLTTTPAYNAAYDFISYYPYLQRELEFNKFFFRFSIHAVVAKT